MNEEAIAARLQQHYIELERLNKIVIGNGSPGLLARIENINARLNDLEQTVARINSNITWIVRLALASLLGQIIQIAFRLKVQ